MRKGRDGGKNGGEKPMKKEKRLMKIVATTSFASSLPPERRPLECCTLVPKEKTGEYSGHYVIASSRPPERRPLKRHMHVPISALTLTVINTGQISVMS